MSTDERIHDAGRLDAVDALPRALEPGRDLWPEIEARLARRTAGAGWPDPRRWAAVTRLAAAVALMVLGGALSQLLWPAGSGPDPGSNPGDVRLAAADEAELEIAEGEYLRAKEALWLAAYGRRDDLSPATLRVVEKNLRIVDEAIRELRLALEKDPGNHRLEGLLYANHRRSLDLLQWLAEASREI